MSNLTSVGLTSGLGTSGTGTISTLDNLIGTAGSPSAQVLSVQGAAGSAVTVQGSLTNISGTVSLPTGASTAALQTTGNTALSTINTTLGTPLQAGGTVVLGAGSSVAGSVKVSDGTNIAGVAPASTAAIGTQPSLVVQLSPNSPGLYATGTQASPSTAYTSSVVAGDIAAASSDSGNPVKVGGVASTSYTAVTNGQRVNSAYDKVGRTLTAGAIRTLKGMQIAGPINDTTQTTIVTATASTFNDLYGIMVLNTSASAQSVSVRDSISGTVRFYLIIPAGDVRGFMLPVDSALPQATVNTSWTITCGSSLSSIYVTAFYVQNI